MNGLLIAVAKAFPKLNPTDKHTTKPGPAVEATASISSIFLPLSFIALSTIQSILKQSFMEELVVFQAHPKRALQLLSIGETKRNEQLDIATHAAMAIVTSMILNLDATLTRG